MTGLSLYSCAEKTRLLTGVATEQSEPVEQPTDEVIEEVDVVQEPEPVVESKSETKTVVARQSSTDTPVWLALTAMILVCLLVLALCTTLLALITGSTVLGFTYLNRKSADRQIKSLDPEKGMKRLGMRDMLEDSARDS